MQEKIEKKVKSGKNSEVRKTGKNSKKVGKTIKRLPLKVVKLGKMVKKSGEKNSEKTGEAGKNNKKFSPLKNSEVRKKNCKKKW